jgi:hypothetical protein
MCTVQPGALSAMDEHGDQRLLVLEPQELSFTGVRFHKVRPAAHSVAFDRRFKMCAAANQGRPCPACCGQGRLTFTSSCHLVHQADVCSVSAPDQRSSCAA